MTTTHQIGDTKLTLSPSEQIVRAARKEVQVTDESGRVLTLRKPSPLSNLDFAKAAGSDRLNVLYLSEVAHLKFVSAIDGQPVACPSTEGELRALYQRLGDDGNEAVQRGVFEHFMSVTSQQSLDEEIKN